MEVRELLQGGSNKRFKKLDTTSLTWSKKNQGMTRLN
jgi:hypothetical protein